MNVIGLLDHSEQKRWLITLLSQFEVERSSDIPFQNSVIDTSTGMSLRADVKDEFSAICTSPAITHLNISSPYFSALQPIHK
jgi:hypothetical protein